VCVCVCTGLHFLTKVQLNVLYIYYCLLSDDDPERSETQRKYSYNIMQK